MQVYAVPFRRTLRLGPEEEDWPFLPPFVVRWL